MTRKDFELIAAVIRERIQYGPASESVETELYCVAQAFAARLGATNEHFDRARFLKACDTDTEV